MKIAEKKIQAVQAYFCEDGKKVKVEDIMKQILIFSKQLTLVMKVGDLCYVYVYCFADLLVSVCFSLCVCMCMCTCVYVCVSVCECMRLSIIFFSRKTSRKLRWKRRRGRGRKPIKLTILG